MSSQEGAGYDSVDLFLEINGCVEINLHAAQGGLFSKTQQSPRNVAGAVSSYRHGAEATSFTYCQGSTAASAFLSPSATT